MNYGNHNRNLGGRHGGFAARKSQAVTTVKAGEWKRSPFADIEKRLPINVCAIEKKSRDVMAWILHLPKNEDRHLKGDAKKFHDDFNDRRYRIVSFASRADKLCKVAVSDIYFNGDFLSVTGWADALAQCLGWFANEMGEEVENLEVAGQMRWLHANNPEDGLLSAMLSGECTANFDDVVSVCRRLQWMFMMCEIPLTHVAVRYNAYTDEQWKKIAGKIRAEEARVAQEENRRRRLAEEKERREKAFAERRARIERLIELEKTGYPHAAEDLHRMGLKKCPECGVWMGKLSAHLRQHQERRRAETVRKTENSSAIASGTYIVVNGVVVFMGRHGFCDNGISHSESDVDDTWRGFGFMARDHGRYGSIDGTDYSN